MILYHGSNLKIDKIDLNWSDRYRHINKRVDI